MSKQKRYEEKNLERRGLVKVCIWIPPLARARVLKMADELRKRFKQENAA